MTPQQSLLLKLASGTVVLALLAVGAFSYVSEREARIRMQAVLDAQTSVQKQNADLIAALQKQIADRDAVYQQQLKTLDAKFSAANNPQQIAALVSSLMGLKEPIQIITPTPTATNPNPQPIAQVPLVDAPQAKAYVQACEECKLELPKVKADLADEKKQRDIDKGTIISITKEKDAAVKAAKGTFWGNFKTRAKWLGIGLIVGGAAICGSGHCKG